MFKFVILACLCAVSLATYSVSFCGGDAATFNPADITLQDAEPIHLLSKPFEVSAKVQITKAFTIDQLNQANLVIDATASWSFIKNLHVCNNGNSILEKGQCTTNFCSAVGADLCTQLAQGPQTLTLTNQAFGPVTSLGWIGNILPKNTAVTMTLKASVVIGTETVGCAQIANLQVDLN